MFVDAIDGAAPAFRLMSLEPIRAALEYASMQFMSKDELPRGDGHAVIVFPGLATDATLTAPLRSFCEKLGYAAHDWGRGINRGPSGDPETWMGELARDTASLIEDGQTASLIGWSLGGIYAREVAKLIPAKIRRVITIGSPLSGDPGSTNVGAIYRLLNGRSADVDATLRERLKQAPSVPTTSIYSRSDGIVAWQACVQPGNAPHTENIEVEGSHCGMAWNPSVLEAVAQRLARPPARSAAMRLS